MLQRHLSSCYSFIQPPHITFPTIVHTTSIMHTYNSNHILWEAVLWVWRISVAVWRISVAWRSSIIFVNHRENTKSQAARLKIIKTHFSEDFVIQPFIEMELNVLPHAISWMGRGGESNETNNHFYAFLRSMPTLFEGDGGQVQL